jgi:predicted aspartyl protease
MIFYYEYSSHTYPSIPIGEVYLGRANTPSEQGPFIAILDTGADVAVMPTSIIRQIGARWIGKGKARGVWGSTRKTNIYTMSLKIASRDFSTVEVLEDTEGKEIIIGRYVLNWFRITFDGLSQHVEISE